MEELERERERNENGSLEKKGLGKSRAWSLEAAVKGPSPEGIYREFSGKDFIHIHHILINILNRIFIILLHCVPQGHHLH